MRVLFCHDSPEWSGSVRAFADGAAALVADGETVVFACRPDSVVEHRLRGIAGIEVAPVAADGTWLDESGRLRPLLREHFIEVICVHTAREHLVAGAAARRAERGAVLRRVPVGDSLAIDATERTAALFAPSGFLFGTHDDLQAVPAPRRPIAPAVVPLGVDVEGRRDVRAAVARTLGIPDGDRLLVCVTDTASRARVATVLRAVALLAERHAGLRLVLVGQGSDHEDLRMHAAALGITHRVGFLGEREDELSVLRAADVGWVVAEHDTAAYAFLDFMSLQIPVVAERGPIAAHYVADGISGTLLPPADAPAGAAAVATLLAQADVRSAMGRAGQVRAARDFTVARMLQTLRGAVEAARDREMWKR